MNEWMNEWMNVWDGWMIKGDQSPYFDQLSLIPDNNDWKGWL